MHFGFSHYKTHFITFMWNSAEAPARTGLKNLSYWGVSPSKWQNLERCYILLFSLSLASTLCPTGYGPLKPSFPNPEIKNGLRSFLITNRPCWTSGFLNDSSAIKIKWLLLRSLFPTRKLSFAKHCSWMDSKLC